MPNTGKDQAVILKLIDEGTIPTVGAFEITNKVIDRFYLIYEDLYSKRGKANRNSAVRYAKKLAGLSLIKLLKTREIEQSVSSTSKQKFGIKGGFVYIVSNPIFPSHFKVGMTKDLKFRLNAYQTSDPFRAFIVEKYIFSENAKQKESDILEEFSSYVSNGEWLNRSCYDQVIEKYFRA